MLTTMPDDMTANIIELNEAWTEFFTGDEAALASRLVEARQAGWGCMSIFKTKERAEHTFGSSEACNAVMDEPGYIIIYHWVGDI